MLVPPRKVCKTCQIEKPLYEFNFSKAYRHSASCAACERENRKKHPAEVEKITKNSPNSISYFCNGKQRHKKAKKPDVGISADGTHYQW